MTEQSIEVIKDIGTTAIEYRSQVERVLASKATTFTVAGTLFKGSNAYFTQLRDGSFIKTAKGIPYVRLTPKYCGKTGKLKRGFED